MSVLLGEFDVESASGETGGVPQKRRWLWFRRGLVLLVVVAAGVAFLSKDHIRTLRSLRHVPGTNAYVLDYYVDYNLNEIRSRGMDVRNVEDGLIRVHFPDVIAPFAVQAKNEYIEEELETIPPQGHRCSTVVWRTDSGRTYFGRNFDWKHDACLILKIHDDEGVQSIAAIDLHYLNLDRDDLESTSLIERIPLLFAPYYLQDGMNRHGVAVADMSVDGARAPSLPGRPALLHSTAMRLILDYASTTDEAVELVKQYNIHFGEATCHLMVADASGKSAVVEFIDGQVVTTARTENWQVCTNHPIAVKNEEQNDEACDRYRRASDELSKLPSAAGAAEVMQVMGGVAQPNWTMWTSVYDLSAGEMYFAYRQRYSNPYRDRIELIFEVRP